MIRGKRLGGVRADCERHGERCHAAQTLAGPCRRRSGRLLSYSDLILLKVPQIRQATGASTVTKETKVVVPATIL